MHESTVSVSSNKHVHRAWHSVPPLFLEPRRGEEGDQSRPQCARRSRKLVSGEPEAISDSQIAQMLSKVSPSRAHGRVPRGDENPSSSDRKGVVGRMTIEELDWRKLTVTGHHIDVTEAFETT